MSLTFIFEKCNELVQLRGVTSLTKDLYKVLIISALSVWLFIYHHNERVKCANIHFKFIKLLKIHFCAFLHIKIIRSLPKFNELWHFRKRMRLIRIFFIILNAFDCIAFLLWHYRFGEQSLETETRPSVEYFYDVNSLLSFLNKNASLSIGRKLMEGNDALTIFKMQASGSHMSNYLAYMKCQFSRQLIVLPWYLLWNYSKTFWIQFEYH